MGNWPVVNQRVVHFLELTSGGLLRTVATGIQGWRRPAQGDFGGHGVPAELRGARRSVQGPAVVELPGATAWVPEAWSGATDAHGTLVLAR